MKQLPLVIICVLAGIVAADPAAPAPQPVINPPPGIRSLESVDAITIPGLISYQGRLTDTLGVPVPNGNYSVVFRLYTVPSGGSPFWNETRDVTTRAGLFSTLLGSVTPIPGVPEAGELYLGLALDGVELSPRLRVASAAYAFLARKADTANYALAGAGGGDNAWTRGAPDSVLYTVNPLGIARGGAANMLYGADRCSHVNFGVACTTGTDSADLAGCTVGGGYANRATALYATVAGGGANRAEMGYATVGGGSGNVASAERATVGGGRENLASGTNATVSGGKYTIAGGYCAAVGGGLDNIAGGSTATVGGGAGNVAAGDQATIAGGFSNRAAGFAAAVPGGFLNAAQGYGSLAAGTCARAGHAGAFVWGDSTASNEDSVFSTGADQFRVRARGGTWFFSNSEMTTGAYLAPGSNSWASACDSATKEDFREVDQRELLDKVAALRVRDYKMRDQGDGTRHIGPVAQDFHAAFSVGENNTSINMADADGVLFAAVQALYEQNQAQQAEIEALKAELRGR